MKVIFQNQELTTQISSYHNHRPALLLMYKEEDGSEACYAKASINMPEELCSEYEVYIKDYSENVGMVDALLTAGVITAPAISKTFNGNVTISKYKLSPTMIAEMKARKTI